MFHFSFQSFLIYMYSYVVHVISLHSALENAENVHAVETFSYLKLLISTLVTCSSELVRFISHWFGT